MDIFAAGLGKIAEKSVQSCPEFSSNGPHKTTLGIFEIISFPFLTSFENFKFTIVAYGSRNQKPQLSGKRTIVEQNGVKVGTRG